MKTKLALLLAFVLIVQSAVSQDPARKTPHRIRIGVDIRMGLQACIDSWTPITDHLTRELPGYRFVIVPLASHNDLVRLLERRDIDFMALDPAMELLAEDRFGVSPLATMIESERGETTFRPADAVCSGAIIRRADRNDIRTVRDLQGKRVAAVKPWSLTGWIAQWSLFRRLRIDPERDFADVAFVGTHRQVVKNVLDKKADVGILDADLLVAMLRNGEIPENSLYSINRLERAVPLLPDGNASATSLYPGRLFAKAAATSDELAKNVAATLMLKTVDTTLDGMPCQVTWTLPANYSKVRRVLQDLMGQDFADSPGFPLPKEYPAWLRSILTLAGVIAIAVVAVLILRSRYRRRDRLLREQLETTRREVIEVRADKQRIDAILSLAGCGIDIVDDNDQVVYADSAIERQYGDWRGKKCYEYYCEADSPCPCCNRPGPLDDENKVVQHLDCSMWSTIPNLNGKAKAAESGTKQMIGIPFHDESGQWLYARIHIPALTPADQEGVWPRASL